ncbi:BnaC08g11040D [Brassica napus]|nr:BnaC08g11040D [Brassica napus]
MFLTTSSSSLHSSICFLLCMSLSEAGIALGELQSLVDLYDFISMATIFLIDVLYVTPTLISKKKA